MAYTTINNPSAHILTQLYTGNGSSTHAITNDASAGDFKPDYLWIKQRSQGSRSHSNWDSSRGNSQRIQANSSGAEETQTNDQKTFDTDGFTVGSGNITNENSQTFVAWQWKANGGTTSTNSSGSITSTVQANTTAGFSIVTYTGNGSAGATIGHGLGVAPDVIIVKVRSATDPWSVYHSANTSSPETDYLVLNSSAATADHDNRWYDTAPTSTLITLGGSGTVNGNGLTNVAYCFAGKQGYSKFGSYTGNGNADGPFIYTGFKPGWLMIKRTDSSGEWIMMDHQRTDYPNANPVDQVLYADSNSAEYSETQGVDFLSNGFKQREAGAGWGNADGGTYVYMAFAEQTLVGTNNVAATAR